MLILSSEIQWIDTGTVRKRT